MPFWTVEDAGPYKEKSNILMRSPLSQVLFFWSGLRGSILAARRRSVSRGSDMPPAYHSTPLPFEPDNLYFFMERITGLEPATSTLGRSRSTG